MIQDSVSFSDFQKLDLRVGKVLKVEKVEGSKNLLRMEVDFGSDYGIQKILAGLAGIFTPAKLKNKKFIFVANLAPKQMLKELSHGMMLVTESKEGINLIPVNKAIPQGAKLV